MTKKLKKRLYRIIVGAVCFLLCILAEKLLPAASDNMLLIAYLVTYFIVGNDVVKSAAANIARGQVFDEKFLMLIATVGAFLTSEYPEAVAVMLFYQIGEWFQSFAVNKTRKSIKELMNIRPDYANVYRNGQIETVDPQEVGKDEIILVKPGERIPLDGYVIKGTTSLDTRELTGESIPRDVQEKDEVISGCINLSGVIEVKVSKEFGESTVSKILNLVENATAKKAETENFITKFSRYYTPVVVILAVLLAVVPSLIWGNWTEWTYRALSFLVISCPCALVISVPLSFFGGIGAASRAGILVKGSNYLEAMASAEMVVMDKTGTLTTGKFEVSKIFAVEEKEEQVLFYAAYGERFSNHPISRCILEAYEKKNREKKSEIEKATEAGLGAETENAGIENAKPEVTEIPGHGVIAIYQQQSIAVGNEKLMIRELGEAVWEENYKQYLANDTDLAGGTVCHVAFAGKYAGYILVEDRVKEDAKDCVAELKKEKISRIVMLTGDRSSVAQRVAEKLDIEEYHAELLPGDKVDKVEELFQKKTPKGKLIFVGDGINDAPVLARADIGIAMGGLGSDAAIEAADIVIMTDEPSKISKAMRISRKTLVIVKQNIVFAIGVKVLVLLLAAVGVATMWAAVFADVGVAFIAILNAMRALKIK